MGATVDAEVVAVDVVVAVVVVVVGDVVAVVVVVPDVVTVEVVVADVVGATKSGEEEDMREMQLAPTTSRCANDDEMDSSSAPPGKRLRTAEEQRGKRKGSQPEAPVRDAK